MLHHNRYKMMNQSLFFQQLIPHRAWRSSLWNIKLLILFLHFCVDEHHIRRMTVTDIVEPADRQTERKTVEIDAAQTEIIWLSVPSININIQLKQNVCVCFVTTLLAVKRLRLLYSTLQFPDHISPERLHAQADIIGGIFSYLTQLL